jgi:hypothetical protein
VILDQNVPHIFAVEFEKIEGAEHHVDAATMVPYQFEHCQPALVTSNRLAIDYAGSDRQGRDCRSCERKAISEVVSVAVRDARLWSGDLRLYESRRA